MGLNGREIVLVKDSNLLLLFLLQLGIGSYVFIAVVILHSTV